MPVFGGVEAVNVGAEGSEIVMMMLTESEPGGEALSVAVTVNMELPALVGVPDRTPEDVNVSPVGSAPAVMLKVMGAVPDAAKV